MTSVYIITTSVLLGHKLPEFAPQFGDSDTAVSQRQQVTPTRAARERDERLLPAQDQLRASREAFKKRTGD